MLNWPNTPRNTEASTPPSQHTAEGGVLAWWNRRLPPATCHGNEGDQHVLPQAREEDVAVSSPVAGLGDHSFT